MTANIRVENVHEKTKQPPKQSLQEISVLTPRQNDDTNLYSEQQTTHIAHSRNLVARNSRSCPKRTSPPTHERHVFMFNPLQSEEDKIKVDFVIVSVNIFIILVA
jgi:hypothetical protein